jgi:pimeloyl-ACP methyl ester carboxylesterase
MTPEPFRLEVPQAVLDDLRQRLARTRWPDAVEGAGWSYGADLGYMKELVAYWQEGFDWRAQERLINSFPNFRVSLDGLRIHFLHVAGRGPKPFPLVLTHGWPGSFLEFLKIIPRLTDPAAHGGDARDAFTIVIPSIPGYGFSDRPTAAGCSNRRIAGLWLALMRGLGYERFGAQGGDWGAGISTWLALEHPEHVVGLHLNYIPGSYYPHLGPESPPLTGAEEQFLAECDRWFEEEGGYAAVQRTFPQTPAYALNDSPVGLAAWIVEKYRAWGDCEGEVERRFSKDELLANVTLYWVTETIHSSMRLYFESRRTPLQLKAGERIAVPTAVADFPKEAPAPPREWVERGYHLVRWTPMPRGGHFAALEEPALLAEDLRAFFRELR